MSEQDYPRAPSLPARSPLRVLRVTQSLTAMTATSPGAGPSSRIFLSSSPPSLSAISITTSPSNSPRSSLPHSLSTVSINESHSVSSRRPSATSSITSVLSTSLPLSHNSTKTLPRVPSDHSLGRHPMSQTSLDREPLAPMAKRKHALLELLSSERVYASDLALIRHIHIPMALGQSSHFQPPDLPPSASADGPPSTRPPSRSALSPSTRSAPTNEVSDRSPMTTEDARVIFSNTEDLAAFADAFVERIEMAIGDALDAVEEGGPGPSDSGSRMDAIGELFLAVAPVINQLYTTYITRHPLALSRLTMLTTSGPSSDKPYASNSSTDSKDAGQRESRGLGVTPEMQSYLAKTRALTQRHTHAWDLPSLLIKPVQRLLKYPLLLQSIIQPTQAFNPGHPDLPYLIKAKDVLETIARDVNESRRRWEVVKAVLEGYGFGPPALRLAPPVRSAPPSVSINGKAFSFARNLGGGKAAKRPQSTGSGASSPSAFGTRYKHGTGPPGDEIAPHPLSRIQSLKTKLKTSFVTLTPSPGAAEEARITLAELTAWEARLKQSEVILRDFFRILVVEWSRSVRDAFASLGGWGTRFGHVIEDPTHNVLHDGKSNDAVRSFVELVNSLVALRTDLDRSLQSTLQPVLTSLLETLARPLTLVQHAIALHPLHMQHLATPYVKNRSPYLLSSSKTFLALQAQLRIEMPYYLSLFDRGFAGIIIKASKLQARFWEECWTRWSLFAIGVGVNGGGMRLPPDMAPIAEDDTSDSGPSQHSSGSSSSNPTILPTPEILPESDEPEAVQHFRKRWDPVDHAIGELMLVRPHLFHPRDSNSSVIDARSSMTSSLLTAVSSEMLSSIATPISSPSSPRPRPRTPERGPTLSPQTTRSRSGTTSTQPSDHSRARSNSSITSNTPAFSPREWSAAAAFETPTSVNAPPKPPTERGNTSRKKTEKIEKATAIQLVQERAKAEKELEKQKGKVKAKVSSSSMMAGVFFPGLVGGSLLSPGLPRPTEEQRAKHASSNQDQEDDDEAAHKSFYRRSDRKERRRQRELEAQNVAQRTKEVLFDLMPSPSVDISPAPTLPTLEQMSPLSISSRSFLADSPTRVRHPYTFVSHPPSPTSPQSGELGMWESLFDASQQSYVFHPHGRSHSEHSTPSQYPHAFPGSDVQTHLEASTSHERAPVGSVIPSTAYNSQSLQYADPEPPTPEHETLYIVSCVHPFHPPIGAKHLGLSFLTLDVGDVVDILLEDGHPSTHEALPIYIDDGDDCMLVGRDERDNIGWCLASFVMPLI